MQLAALRGRAGTHLQHILLVHHAVDGEGARDGLSLGLLPLACCLQPLCLRRHRNHHNVGCCCCCSCFCWLQLLLCLRLWLLLGCLTVPGLKLWAVAIVQVLSPGPLVTAGSSSCYCCFCCCS